MNQRTVLFHEPLTHPASDPDPDLSIEVLGRKLLGGLAAVQVDQMATGEIASYQRNSRHELEYRRSPFISAFVYDTLSIFDPWSAWLQPSALDIIPVRYKRWFMLETAKIRHRIREFIHWQEESGGFWRLLGRGSGINPDLATTACAAAVFLEKRGHSSWLNWQRHYHALLRFLSVEGLFYSFMDPRGNGYGWLDQAGLPVSGFDRVINTEALRYLTLCGMGSQVVIERIIDFIRSEIIDGDLERGTQLFPNPFYFFYAVTRAWRQAHLPGMEELSSILIPRILGMQKDPGDFGSPLNTALAAAALLDLNYEGGELACAWSTLLRGAESAKDWQEGSTWIFGFESLAGTVALSMAVLARGRLSAGVYSA
jgi:hypothetical protein